MKTIISVLLAILIQFATISGSVSTVSTSSGDALYDDDEMVNVIVELDKKGLLENVNSSEKREKLLEDFQSSSAYKAIVKSQEDLKARIEEKFALADFSSGYTYSFVMNGISLSIPYKYVEKLEKLSGVKAVEISESYTMTDPTEESDSIVDINNVTDSLADEGKFTGVNNAHEEGYTGKGIVCAVLDTGFDIDHEAFANDVEDPTLSKSDINLLTTFGCLNTIVPIYKHYVSEKIPYKWDYANVDSDVSNSQNSHGTHVAGILAGDSETITGVAPDAQLLLMKVFKDGENPKTEEYMYLAALDDAVKLGADIINMSFSTASGQQPSNIFTDAVIKRLENSGISVIASAGNDASTGYDDATAGSNTVSADIFDYGTVGSPSTYEWCMSVASSGIYPRTSIYKEAINVAGVGSQYMSSYSAWGVSADLKLKPEITAPGDNLYSSINGNSYEYMSGTSMSSPYFAGCYALLKQYINENSPSDKNRDNTEFLNSILMSTATPFRGYGQSAVYSPRRQGAGLVNLDGALSTKAYLTDAEGNRPKIELGEDTDGTLEMTFVLHNLSSEELSYTLDFTPLTDSYYFNNGQYVNTLAAENISKKDYTLEYVSGVNSDGTVDLEPNSQKKISIRVTFSDSFIASQSEVFSNGFFLDGFVYLKCTDETQPTLSIPYVAFYGDWDKDMLFDNTMYSGSPSYLGKQWGLYVTDGESYYPLGANMFESKTEYDIDTKYCAYSKNAMSGQMSKPYVTACVGLLRNAKRVDYNLFTDSGVFRYCGSTMLDYIRKTTDSNSPITGVLWGGKSGLINGNSYVYKVSTTAANYDSGRETLSFPFVVDNDAPVVNSATYSNDGTLKLTISDNHYVQGFRVLTADGKTVGDVSFKSIEPTDGSYEYELNVETLSDGKFTSAELQNIVVYIVDYAYNETTVSLSSESSTIESAAPADFDAAAADVVQYFSTDNSAIETSTTETNYGIFDKAIKRLQEKLKDYD